MKQLFHRGLDSLIFVLLVFFLAATLVQQARAHGGSGSVTPAVSSISTTTASGYVSGTGLSVQGVTNQGSAVVNGGAAGTGLGLGPLKDAGAAAQGTAQTTNTTVGGGLTLGAGTGSYEGAGLSKASISGQAEGHTVTNGPAAIANGNVETLTGTKVAGSGTSLGGVSAGVSGSFDAAAHASQVKLGNFNAVDTTSHALGGVVGTVNFNGSFGDATTTVDNQGAFNAFGQSKVGLQVSQ